MKSIVIYTTIFTILALSLLHGEVQPLPERMRVENYVFYNQEEISTTVQITRQNSGGYRFASNAESQAWEVITDRNLNVIESSQTYLKEETINQVGIKSFQIQQKSPGEYFFSKITNRNKTKETDISINNLQDFNILVYTIPYRTIPGDRDLEIQLYEPSMMRSYALALTSLDMQGPAVSSNYADFQFPQPVIEMLNGLGQVTVIEGHLTGMAGKFYPHKFYYLIGESQWVDLQWGGKPEEAYFAINRYIQ